MYATELVGWVAMDGSMYCLEDAVGERIAVAVYREEVENDEVQDVCKTCQNPLID